MQDLQRINWLIDAARDCCNPRKDSTVALKVGVSPKVLSNWRTGHKTPSLEAQCELAVIGGKSAPRTALASMVEATEGLRGKRLQAALLRLIETEDENRLGINLEFPFLPPTPGTNWNDVVHEPEADEVRAALNAKNPASLSTGGVSVWRKRRDSNPR